jgi:hypothetical protein
MYVEMGSDMRSDYNKGLHQQNRNKYTYTYLPIDSSLMFLFSHMLGHPWKW